MNLTNSVALITGGTAGIGRAIAGSLVEAGARVAVTGRDRNKLDEIARSLGVLPRFTRMWLWKPTWSALIGK